MDTANVHTVVQSETIEPKGLCVENVLSNMSILNVSYHVVCSSGSIYQ